MGQHRDRQLRALHRLFRAFLASEQAVRDDLRNKLLAEQVTIQRDLLAVKQDEYRRRRELGLARKEISEKADNGVIGA
jgi:hypothetical protein